jgi:uncharacterized repeat protein (TIGR03803 family)
LTPPLSPSGAWTEAVLYNFTGGSDGANPQAPVTSPGGVLYGTTAGGGASEAGTVFSLSPPASAGGSWTETVIHSFIGSDGTTPEGGLAIHSGVIYGTTNGGGASGLGTVFSLTPPASFGGSWTEAVLHSFGGGHDGSSPRQALQSPPTECSSARPQMADSTVS